MDWDEIFKIGRHTDSAGRTRTWTKADLDLMVEKYSPQHMEAPLVFGHPKTNEPAYGWVEKLKREGERLYAKYKDVADGVKELIQTRRYAKKSISINHDGTLRHVGLLGAVPPAVPGLRDIQLQKTSDAMIYEFSNESEFAELKQKLEHEQQKKGKYMDELEKLKQELEQEKQKNSDLSAKAKEAEHALKQKGAEFSTFMKQEKEKSLNTWFDNLVEKGKAIPAWKDDVLSFAKLLDTHEVYEFAEGVKESPLKRFKDFMEGMDSHELFKKMRSPNNEDDNRDYVDMTDLTEYV